VAKPEWGKKRTCQSCGALFYDMTKNPAACPTCGTADNLQPLLKPRRTPAPPPPKPVAVPAPAENDNNDDGDDDAGDEVPDDIEDVEVDDDEDEDLIVDASDLGDEDDDVSEVKEHIEPGDNKD